MPFAARPLAVVIVLAALVASPDVDARRHSKGHGHGRGHHHGWLQARVSRLGAWLRRASPAPRREAPRVDMAERQREAARLRAAIDAERAQRRSADVAAFVESHPPVTLR